MKLVFTLLSGAVFMTATFAANAQSSIEKQLLMCKSETDSLKRLMCYDGLVSQLDSGQAQVVAPAAATTQQAQTSSQQTVVANPPVTQTQPQVQPAVPSKAEDTFGNEYKPDREEWLDEVKLEIAEAKLNASNKWRVTFTNGQRWQAQETKSNVRFKAGDVVIIMRGAWSAFYMKKEGSNRKVRVKRL